MQKYNILIFGISLTLIPILSSSFITFWTIEQVQWIQGFSLKNWLLISLVFTITSAFAFTPPTFLALLMGYFLGIKAIILLLPINLGAIMLVYALTQQLDKSMITQFLMKHDKSRQVLQNLHQDSWKVVFFTKLSPILPFALTNFIFAISGIQLRNILWGGFLGMLPRTILAVWVGSQGSTLKELLQNPNQEKIMQVGFFILLFISVWGILRIFTRTIK